ncbi:MAG: hypothetical protein CMK89_14125 [Pseudomonadales bacterium]|nr:hypothetical protein [Pseudomonadales bacterium]
MKWLFSKKTDTDSGKKRSASVESIRQKLSNYQATEGRSVFVGPSTAQWGDTFEYERVAIDPEGSGFHRIPFHC